jgi:tRNA pseudouridine38-40 synthase
MHEAAQILVGKHDFSSFRATGCQAASPIRTLDELSVTRTDTEIHIRARARSFLHHQIRNFAGSLVNVGAGKWSAQDLAHILAAKDRTQAGQTAPAHALYLTSVRYPELEET